MLMAYHLITVITSIIISLVALSRVSALGKKCAKEILLAKETLCGISLSFNRFANKSRPFTLGIFSDTFSPIFAQTWFMFGYAVVKWKRATICQSHIFRVFSVLFAQADKIEKTRGLKLI